MTAIVHTVMALVLACCVAAVIYGVVKYRNASKDFKADTRARLDMWMIEVESNLRKQGADAAANPTDADDGRSSTEPATTAEEPDAAAVLCSDDAPEQDDAPDQDDAPPVSRERLIADDVTSFLSGAHPSPGAPDQTQRNHSPHPPA